MKNQVCQFLVIAGIAALTLVGAGNAQEPNRTGLGENKSFDTSSSQTRVGIVNTKRCLEESKLGQQEQANFEKMKKQMKSVLQEKEQALEEIESKLNDDDYMETAAEEVTIELTRKRRAIRNEGRQLQGQYMQMLQEANVDILQRVTEAIAKASSQVAQESQGNQRIDVILTDEACTYFSPKLDVSSQVIQKMNGFYEEKK